MRGKPSGSYGIDAPYVPILSGIAGVVLILLGITAQGFTRWWCLVFGVLFFVQVLLYLRATTVGKFEIWDDVLDDLQLSGDERVLDVGCGRGMALIMAAARLPKGRATGLDLWRTQDQSGNSEESARENAEAAGVTDRITLETGDMTEMPFPAGSFEVVLANVAVQNIKNRSKRAAAIGEMWRVLRPGGRLRIVDIQYTKEYQRALADLGAAAVSRKGLGWRMWYGNPFFGASLVSATKPGGRRR